MTVVYVLRNRWRGQELVCVQLADLAEWPAASLVDGYFVAFLALDAGDTDDETLIGFATQLLAQGAVYVCCWGQGCKRVHDIFDDVYLDMVGLAFRADEVVVTTFHPDESLAEALRFSLYVSPADAYVTGNPPTLVAVTNLLSRESDAADYIAEALRDPARFSAHVQGESIRDRPKRLQGTVRWWKDEKGYGRITGDDGYIYFCHFSTLQIDGYKTLRQGQRVEFERVERMGDHGRAGAVNVRVLEA